MCIRDRVRTGQVRVLLGSTAKMGAGTNVQDRLVALHDLDCPWRPGDLAQRKGRIERQMCIRDRYDAVRRPIPQRTSYDPAAPVYAVGDTVYIEDDAYQIAELREDTVQLLPTGMVYPIYRAERKEQFEQLLRADRRNAYYTEFLPIDPNKADQDLRDVLAHGLMDEADKKQISTLLQSGRSNSEIAYWLSRAYSGEIETLNLETGDI